MATLLSEEQDVSLVGQTISHYEILSKLGEGGMGEVYLAEDVTLRRKVALKLLPALYTEDKDRLRRFTQEARAASALNHPNILTIYEIGSVADNHFIATEYIDGETLRQRIAAARMRPEQAIDVAAQIASALSAAHEAGIVHRDIKPENIMLRRDGYVKVLDFGLAKLVELRTPVVNMEAPTRVPTNTNPGMVLGTVAYMSPEQARGLAVDERTDIFSFGVVLCEMIAGRQPFEGETPLDVLTAILRSEPDALSQHAPDVPPKLEQIVSKALSKEREQRYQSVNEMLTDLKELKREMELHAELERTASPESRERASSGSSVALTVKAQGAQTGADQAHTTSSAEYIVNQVKSHRRAVAATLIVLALAAAVAAGLIWRFKHSGASKLTEQDTILIADFENRTGDEVFDGALKQALARQLDTGNLHNGLYLIAQVRGDAALAQQQIDWSAGKPDEYRALNVQAQAAIFSGQLKKSREFTSRAVDMSLSRNVKEAAAQFASTNALNEALLGNCGQAREDSAKALAIVRSNTSLLNGAVVASLCGEAGQTQSLADELSRKNPTATLINAVGLPVIRAAVEIHNNNPTQAVHSLQTATPYEGSAFAAFLSNYIRGQAYLHAHAGAEAAAEFQKILDHRGWATLSPLYPLAHLGLARAAVLKGDTAKARKSYEDFFALWRDADSDIPILQQASEEYRRLEPTD